MHEIIFRKFDQWTRNLNPEEKRISIFEHIRDIPYFVTYVTDPVRGPVELLVQNRGNCSPKHFLLSAMYEKLEIPVKYVSYPFVWSDQKIEFPEKLKKLIDKLPVCYHISLMAHINHKWVLLDVTWDPPLKRVHFPVNETWDGFSDTQNAVTPMGEVIHRSIQERLDYLEKTAKYTEAQLDLLDIFRSELNTWLQKVRSEL